MSKLRANEIDTITGSNPINVEGLAADRQNYLSNYDSFSDAISSASILGKSLIIDQPADLGGASVDCLGVGLVWLSEGNLISNGTVNISGCHITAGRFKIFDGVTLLGTPDLTPVEGYELSSKEYTDTKVSLTDNETIVGVKTFSSFPVTPLSNPITDYQVANKKYVDSRVLDTSLTITEVKAQLAQKAKQADLEIERARISNLTANAGNTDGNAELIDIRVGFDGITYATAGDATRALSNYMIEENQDWGVN